MSILMSDGCLEMVRKIDIINAIHLTDKDSIEFIYKPLEFLPLWVDPVNFWRSAGFFNLTVNGSPLRGGR